jgi:hypothetical protein
MMIPYPKELVAGRLAKMIGALKGEYDQVMAEMEKADYPEGYTAALMPITLAQRECDRNYHAVEASDGPILLTPDEAFELGIIEKEDTEEI